jgi:tungstate transport system permease protein
MLVVAAADSDVMRGTGGIIAEFGAVLAAGGNVRGFTRTMTTAVATETSKGNLSLALGPGLTLILLSLLVSAAASAINHAAAGH